MRIYADESGTHGGHWLVIGMLFVPDHHLLHPALTNTKDTLRYFNTSKKHAKYRETHFANFQSLIDVEVARKWSDEFCLSTAYFRAVVVDWRIYQGKYFGDPFEPESLKKRRAYKKWAEMLLHPEVSASKFHGASFYLDRLDVIHRYDVITHLRERFSKDEYQGKDPWIREYQAVSSWKDAHQCLQLCDLLVGALNQGLTPSTNEFKLEARDYLLKKLEPYKIKSFGPSFWRGYSKSTLTKHFPRFSVWFWEPT